MIVGVTRPPFKCPPAPSETALLMHDFLTARGLREKSEIALVMPLPVPIPPSPAASEAVLAAFAEKNIEFVAQNGVKALDPERRMVILGDDSERPYDLFLGVPVHKVPAVVEASGLTVDGWIPVNPLTLETSFADVYACGDVTSVGTPKAGVFSERQAGVIADAIIARAQGKGNDSEYDGRGICYLEFGDDEVAKVEVQFVPGEPPQRHVRTASETLAADKAEFGRTRVERWFGQDRPTSA